MRILTAISARASVMKKDGDMMQVTIVDNTSREVMSIDGPRMSIIATRWLDVRCEGWVGNH